MSKQRQKGTAFETLIVDFLREHGFPEASRSPLHGNKDTGDTVNTPPFVMEMKNCRQMSLGAWLDEAMAEASNAYIRDGHDWLPLVIHKRRGKGWAGHQFVTMDLDTFVNAVRKLLYATPKVAA